VESETRCISGGGSGVLLHLIQQHSTAVHLLFKKKINKYEQPPPIIPVRLNIKVPFNQVAVSIIIIIYYNIILLYNEGKKNW
jgi:hypothetical protein